MGSSGLFDVSENLAISMVHPKTYQALLQSDRKKYYLANKMMKVLK